MSVLLAGLNHMTAGIELRERLAIPARGLTEALTILENPITNTEDPSCSFVESLLLV